MRDIYFGSNRSPKFEGDPRIEDKIIASLEILLAAGADIDARITDSQSRTARIARSEWDERPRGQTALYSAAAAVGRESRSSWSSTERTSISSMRGGKSPLDAALATVNGEATKGSEAVAELLRKALGNRTAAVRP